MEPLLFAYQSSKIWLSDSSCFLLQQVTPDLFGNYCTRFIDGFFVTIELLLLASFFAFVIAVPMALLRTSLIRPLAWLVYAYTYVLRGTPLLVQLWIFYYGFGALGKETLGVFWVIFEDGWQVGLLVLTLNSSAYVTEILRGGIDNVAKGQVEAAVAIGMSWRQRMQRIVLPQALTIAWPAYGNEVILLLKGSALVSTITVFDLMGVTRTVYSRSYSLEIFLYATVLYLIMVVAFTYVLRVAENRYFSHSKG